MPVVPSIAYTPPIPPIPVVDDYLQNQLLVNILNEPYSTTSSPWVDIPHSRLIIPIEKLIQQGLTEVYFLCHKDAKFKVRLYHYWDGTGDRETKEITEIMEEVSEYILNVAEHRKILALQLQGGSSDGTSATIDRAALYFVRPTSPYYNLIIYPTDVAGVCSSDPDSAWGEVGLIGYSVFDKWYRTWVKFSLSNLQNKVFKKVEFQIATRAAFEGQGTPSGQVAVHIAGINWTEPTLTWNNQPSIGDAVGYYTPEPLTKFNIDVTKTVSEKLATGETTLSLCLKDKEETQETDNYHSICTRTTLPALLLIAKVKR